MIFKNFYDILLNDITAQIIENRPGTNLSLKFINKF